jgi:hypothetical protein
VFDVPLDAASLTATLQTLLTEIQGVYLEEARAFRDANIVDVTTYDELKVRSSAGSAVGVWDQGWVLGQALGRTDGGATHAPSLRAPTARCSDAPKSNQAALYSVRAAPHSACARGIDVGGTLVSELGRGC